MISCGVNTTSRLARYEELCEVRRNDTEHLPPTGDLRLSQLQRPFMLDRSFKYWKAHDFPKHQHSAFGPEIRHYLPSLHKRRPLATTRSISLTMSMHYYYPIKFILTIRPAFFVSHTNSVCHNCAVIVIYLQLSLPPESERGLWEGQGRAIAFSS